MRTSSFGAAIAGLPPRLRPLATAGGARSPLPRSGAGPLLQLLHPPQQLVHHPQRLLAQPFRGSWAVESKGRPHRPAAAAVGAAQGLEQFMAQAGTAAVQLLLEAESGVPPVAPQLLLQTPQTPGRPDAQRLPAGMAGQGAPPAFHQVGTEAMGGTDGDAAARRLRRRPGRPRGPRAGRGRPGPAGLSRGGRVLPGRSPHRLPGAGWIRCPLQKGLQLQTQGAHLPAQRLVLRQQRLDVGGQRPGTGGGSPAARIEAHRGRSSRTAAIVPESPQAAPRPGSPRASATAR